MAMVRPSSLSVKRPRGGGVHEEEEQEEQKQQAQESRRRGKSIKERRIRKR
jgi:hypothetical protein